MLCKGLLVVVSGPSGAGKGTLLEVFRKKENIKFSVSATTREKRKNEVHGENYFFKTRLEFEKMIEDGELLEWVNYCDNYYGTPKKYIEESLEKGYDVLLEVEVEGAKNIIEKYPECVSVFILPPSFEELKKRIVGRGTESQEQIDKRLEKARTEINLASNYSYMVVNNLVEESADLINNILISEKLKVSRNKEFLKRFSV